MTVSMARQAPVLALFCSRFNACPVEMAVTIGADGFSYTREGEALPEYKLGNQL